MADTPPGKPAPDLLHELDRLKQLLHPADDDIPLLDDVVRPIRPRGSAAAAPKPADATAPATPPLSPATQGELPGLHLPPPSEQELEALLDRIIDREMPRIRLELKRALRDELRMRGLLK